MSIYRIRDKRTRKFVEKFLTEKQINEELNRQCGGLQMHPIKLELAEGLTLTLEQGEVAKVLPDGIYPYPAFKPLEDGDYLVWDEESGWLIDYWDSECDAFSFEDTDSPHPYHILYFRELPGDPTKMDK